jgi:hypothetical protein
MSANQGVNEHLLLSDPLPEEDRNRSLSYKSFLAGLFLSLNHTPQNGFPATFYPMFAQRFTRFCGDPKHSVVTLLRGDRDPSSQQVWE